MSKAIPEGLHTVTPALTIDGCADAIEFYKKAFGAVLVQSAPDPSGKKIWHAQIRIGDSAIFLNDAFPEMGSAPSAASLWIYSGDVDAAFKRAVDAGAQARMPPADMFWGDRMASVADRWGNRWTLATHVKDLTPDEMKRAQDEASAQWNKKK
ncbi:MAG TPA: VOC family protein [Polyangiaceae bacterium]|nr:VOC family protein [Polyangiaceae bacterium]